MRLVFLFLLAAPANADVVRDLHPLIEEAEATFARMPEIVPTDNLATACGGGPASNAHLQYCATDNRIYLRPDLLSELGGRDPAAYMLAHLYGHAVQVQHGIADIALARIVAERAREAEFRGWVTRQVECIAGVLHVRSFGNVGAGPEQWFAAEPFTGSHWGANPVGARAKVSIGLDVRDAWFRVGQRSGDFTACTVGEFPADLIVEAERQGVRP